MFIIPKGVLKEVNDGNFLWTRTHNDGKVGTVAWSRLCFSKSVGGLGFKDTGLRNIAAVCKLAWVVAQKKENLWVRWVIGVHIDEDN